MTRGDVDHQKHYDPHGCQSLLGYGRQVHERSGGVCELCDAGKGQNPDFAFWRQLTVEHLIGESQGGRKPRIIRALERKFPHASATERTKRAEQLELANMVTACRFCNSTTSHHQHAVTMEDVILAADNTWDAVVQAVRVEAASILERKRADVAWKLESIKKEFDAHVLPRLCERRQTTVGKHEGLTEVESSSI